MYLLIHFNYKTIVSLYVYVVYLYNKFHCLDHKILLTYMLLHIYTAFVGVGDPTLCYRHY